MAIRGRTGPNRVAPPKHLAAGALAQCAMAAHIWVECAECSKWRRVPPLSDEGARWRCADNADARFASCAAPQELSDDEIDAQLKAQARPARTAHAIGLLLSRPLCAHLWHAWPLLRQRRDRPARRGGLAACAARRSEQPGRLKAPSLGLRAEV